MRSEHIEAVADLQVRLIHCLLSDLGLAATREFYLDALRRPQNFGFVYAEEGRVLGYSFGTEDNSLVFSGTRVRFEIFRAVATRPSLAVKVVSQMKNRFPRCAERLYGAVDPSCRSKGVAIRLYARLNREFWDRGVREFEDSVDVENQGALKLLQFLGAEIKGQYEERGLQRYRLVTQAKQH